MEFPYFIMEKSWNLKVQMEHKPCLLRVSHTEIKGCHMLLGFNHFICLVHSVKDKHSTHSHKKLRTLKYF